MPVIFGTPARGTVALAGPVGDDVNNGDALVLIAATDTNAALAILEDDPWHDVILSTRAVEQWTFWIGPFAE